MAFNVYNKVKSTVVGITKAPCVNLSASKIFDLTKVPIKLFESYLYLTGATAAELRWHSAAVTPAQYKHDIQ